jgi:hypothetical protein
MHCPSIANDKPDRSRILVKIPSIRASERLDAGERRLKRLRIVRRIIDDPENAISGFEGYPAESYGAPVR